MKLFNGNYALDTFSNVPEAKERCVDTFIITRFNLRLWSKDKHNRSTLSKEWLEERFKLFDTYCFPSIKAQTNQYFLWVCLFDEELTMPYIDKIKEYVKESKVFLPIFIDKEDSSNVTRCISDIILKFKDESRDLITIRLDNDDALSVEFIETVKEYAKNVTETTIHSFKYGIQYYVKDRLAVHIPFYNNHFLSLINKNFDWNDYKELQVQHVLQFNHYDTKKYPYPFVCDKQHENMWVEVIHPTNVSNDSKLTLNQGPIKQRNYMIEKFNWGGQFKLPYVSELDFWRFMSMRILKHATMKIWKKI